MKYKQLISFNPITTVIQLTDANNVTEEEKLVRSYVMSDEMEKRIADIMLGQLQFEEYNDNKGIFLVGNYGTGKCNFEITKSNMILKRVAEDTFDGTLVEHAVKVPVLINYSVGTKRYFKEPDEHDLKIIETCKPAYWVPSDELPEGYNTEQPKHSHGMNRVLLTYHVS